MKYNFGIYRKKVNFLFILSIKGGGGGGGGKTFLQSFLNNFAWLSAFSGYNIECKHSFHLENGLKCHFNSPRTDVHANYLYVSSKVTSDFRRHFI